ncbi:hypothetical protein ACA758_04365 [Mycoplasmopsis agassizii]|uniref:DUF4231 domain-containing protein n=1 Tax=Mycoplasmopsis agassizii TaxID=33922 RepID=A0ABX4H566_9BACT|nr:hypothetical protein [Mycoplasmopsis agassizii]PAF55022.1 hypothetical protein CJF60_04800 [Mycoplasmopsis agassizii]SMC17520.1 hypothetical protein SAMN02745179_00479 [Mycoplasmopsis agassizii]
MANIMKFLFKNNDENSLLNKDPKRKDAYQKYEAIRAINEKKEKRSKNTFLALRFLQLFLNFSLLILNLLQIRYNIFPVETIVFFIAITIMFALITFVDSIISLFAFKNSINVLQEEKKLAELTLSDIKGNNYPQEIVEIYESIVETQNKNDTEL